MQLKLKEDPKEWLKFTAVLTTGAGIVVWLLFRRHVVSLKLALTTSLCLVLTVFACALRPHWFRGVYRGGMTGSFYFGQLTARVLLTVFFLFALTPLAVLLRLLGKDLLGIKPKSTDSYWHPVRSSSPFERQF
jgi:hypothetical protein